MSGADIERFAKQEIGNLSGEEIDPQKQKIETLDPKEIQSYYDKFNKSVAGRTPAPSIDMDIIDEPPFELNIFIEAKVPLMANVLFPHSIHTYWLKCSNCHPGIFLPQVGANDIKMSEIFEGKWCGRCHGKVAFTFWPRANCVRCHIIPKGESLSKEHWQ